MADIITPKNDDKTASVISKAASIGMQFLNKKKDAKKTEEKSGALTRRMAGTHNLNGNKEEEKAKGVV